MTAPHHHHHQKNINNNNNITTVATHDTVPDSLEDIHDAANVTQHRSSLPHNRHHNPPLPRPLFLLERGCRLKSPAVVLAPTISPAPAHTSAGNRYAPRLRHRRRTRPSSPHGTSPSGRQQRQQHHKHRKVSCRRKECARRDRSATCCNRHELCAVQASHRG